MRTSTWVTIVVIVIIIAVGAFVYTHHTQQASPESPATSSQTLINTVVYSCDQGKTITAAYYQGPAAPQPAPGQPPTPTGSVEVSLNGAPTTTLAQTISADGTRYSDGNPQTPQGQPGAETLVFWSKGDSALVMRNNVMDMDYTNCTEASTTAQAQ